MEHQVFADIEIEGEKIDYYSSVIIRQQFNAHHEFAIRIRHDVLERIGGFSMNSAQRMIGKLAIIKLLEADSLEADYEFHGLICEIGLEQSGNYTSYLVLKGYSPTILLESGPHFSSFYKKNLQQIVQQLTQSLSQACLVNVAPQYGSQITYISQYRESTFHFLNRLSDDFGEWFYYDGIDLFFGKPSSPPEREVVYGLDVHHLQRKLRILPLAFNNYAYVSKNDQLIQADAPSSVDGLGDAARFALQESDKVFAEKVSFPARQRVENNAELTNFVKRRKTSMAADLEVVSGSSDNPAICIGAVADIKVETREANALAREDYGKFLITSIEHHLTENKKYYNTFEGIPSGIEYVPVRNVIMPIAEPQIATVMDNKDPDNMGRVRVQMLWQQQGGGQTDWLRVMTPDAGGGKDGAKNRGLVVVPEKGDQVLVGFRYNDPDRPFVMGGMFHGKTGGGGGQGNNGKSLTSKSGHTLSFDDGKGISIVDKTTGNKIEIDGTNTITVTASQKIELTNGKSTITMDGDTISITAAHVSIEGTDDSSIQSSGNGLSNTAKGGEVSVNGTKTTVVGSQEVTATGAKATLNGDSEATVNGGGKTTVSAGGKVAVQGAIVALN